MGDGDRPKVLHIQVLSERGDRTAQATWVGDNSPHIGVQLQPTGGVSESDAPPLQLADGVPQIPFRQTLCRRLAGSQRYAREAGKLDHLPEETVQGGERLRNCPVPTQHGGQHRPRDGAPIGQGGDLRSPSEQGHEVIVIKAAQ